MRILVLSAYDAQSHQYWRTSLEEQFPQYEWTQLSLPARYFSWRVRGNSLSWAYNERETLEQPWDLIIATSMVDLSALRGFVPNISQVPTLVYFHENQFDYPASGNEISLVEPQLLSIYTALCADKIAFNSHYNRDTFLDGCSKLLKKLPDQVPKDISKLISAKSSVLPVPLKQLPDQLLTSLKQNKLQNTDAPLEIVWNHRWEYDKGPDTLYLVLKALMEQKVQCRVHVVGQRFRQIPEAFNKIQQECQSILGQWGYLERKADYWTLLFSSDVVLSTATHDFQGLAILEAVQAGCIPLVPNRLAYPEYLPKQYCYQTSSQEHEVVSIVNALKERADQKRLGDMANVPDIGQLEWRSLKESYLRLVNELT